jgi:hypothetical protein
MWSFFIDQLSRMRRQWIAVEISRNRDDRDAAFFSGRRLRAQGSLLRAAGVRRAFGVNRRLAGAIRIA